VEIIHLLPLKHKDKVVITVIASLSIGMGAALTPIGEPLATIATSKLNESFFYLFTTLGIYIILAVLA
jgi:predicted cation transporter